MPTALVTVWVASVTGRRDKRWIELPHRWSITADTVTQARQLAVTKQQQFHTLAAITGAVVTGWLAVEENDDQYGEW